jgi:hypothetical protein
VAVAFGADDVEGAHRTPVYCRYIKTVTETARVLLTAAILSAVGLAVFVWRLARPGRLPHEYLIDQLTLSQWAALLLAAAGATSVGVAVAMASAPGAFVEATSGVLTIAVSVIIFRCEPPRALLVAGGLFLGHAFFDWAHRPGFLTTELVPQWWALGNTLYDVHIAALCLMAMRAGR